MAEKTRIPLHRDPRVRGIVFQVIVAALVIWSLATIFNNTVKNLRERGIQTGISFFEEVAPFGVGFSPVLDFKLGESTYWDVFLIGIQNTIIVSILGIVAATVLGFTVGVLRLSPNWLISRLALFYIETMRNIPLLLQIMFWNFAIFLPLLPGPRQSLKIGDAIFLNSRGFYSPLPVVQESTGAIIVVILGILGLVGTYLLKKWAKRRQDLTGATFPAISLGLLGTIILVLLGLFITGGPISLEYPELSRFNLSGGMEFPLPLFSLWFALTTYTAAFIAENVRGGIQAVDKGQTEASQALGLSRTRMLRLVVIPQAMRVIIPPTISQFLNLTKNSSLAVAVAYEELVSIWAGISLNQTGQALIIIAMTIAVYETLSLMTSAILNYYNKRVQLVER
ncbi:MAG: amino acid ABC transporter permease [Rhizobiaceae bacterium]